MTLFEAMIRVLETSWLLLNFLATVVLVFTVAWLLVAAFMVGYEKKYHWAYTTLARIGFILAAFVEVILIVWYWGSFDAFGRQIFGESYKF